MNEVTKLNKGQLDAIAYEVEQLLGPEPTLDSIAAEGYRENETLNRTLESIAGVGRVVTLVVAEMIQAGAALIIAVVFALLEYWRVFHGAAALGQAEEQAALIAFAVVVANVVHPIYALRQLRGQQQLHILKQTGRGYVATFWRRLTGKPTIEAVDLYHNPTLHIAAAVITWSTVILAVYDILSPMLNQLFAGTYTKPFPIMGMELLMGLGLSIAGVFFLQSAAHEIGVRTLTDQPQRLTDVLEARRAERSQRQQQLRAEVMQRVMAAQVADAQRKVHSAGETPFGSTALDSEREGPDSTKMTAHVNGHGGIATGHN